MLKYMATALLLAGVTFAQSPLLQKVTCQNPIPNGFTCALVYAVRWLNQSPMRSPASPADTPQPSQPIVRGPNVYVPSLSAAPAVAAAPVPAIHGIAVIIGTTLYEAKFNPPMAGVVVPDGVAALAIEEWVVLSWNRQEIAGRVIRRQKLPADWRWYDPPWKRNRNLPLDQ